MEQESQKRKLDDGVRETSSAPILCVNNCGFFGSAITNNLCSKCYKDHVLTQTIEASVVKENLPGNQVMENVVNVRVEAVEPMMVEEGASSGNRPANRCSFCRKRVGLTGFKCRCDQMFCSLHRYSDKHNCAFDYKGVAQDAIAKANPIVKADKIEKI